MPSGLALLRSEPIGVMLPSLCPDCTMRCRVVSCRSRGGAAWGREGGKQDGTAPGLAHWVGAG